MFYVAGWLSSSGLIHTTINFKAELCWLVCGSTETQFTVDNQLKNAADQQSPFHHANCARHRLSKRGCGLNMWACTSCFPPNPISPDKTLPSYFAKVLHTALSSFLKSKLFWRKSEWNFGHNCNDLRGHRPYD